MAELVLGIDDAGRGCVIGPMILAGVLIYKKDEEKLKREGVKDSKQLFHEKRVSLDKKIKKIAVDFHITETSPEFIDENIGKGFNLNKIEALRAAEIINQINTKSRQREKITVFVDCPSVNIPKWRAFLIGYVEHPDNLEFKVEHKADVNHASCSAASILAKVKREEEVEKLKKKLSIDFGSGYPADPITIKFLKENYEKYRKYRIFRESWATIKDGLKGNNAKKQQKSLSEF